MKIKLTLEYKGTQYHGWQIQLNSLSVQAVLQNAAQKIFCAAVSIIGAGRTDTGVHACGQVAVLSVDTALEPIRIKKAFNFYLPSDIVVLDAAFVDAAFHPRYSAKAKVYRYRIFNRKEPSPFYNDTAFFYPHTLNVPAMQEAASYFIGEHDFTSFASNAQRPDENKKRHIFAVDITYNAPTCDIIVSGKSFLYRMVRAMAGALLAVGRGQRQPMWIKELLEKKNRCQGPEVLPAHGLALLRVEY